MEQDNKRRISWKTIVIVVLVAILAVTLFRMETYRELALAATEQATRATTAAGLSGGDQTRATSASTVYVTPHGEKQVRLVVAGADHAAAQLDVRGHVHSSSSSPIMSGSPSLMPSCMMTAFPTIGWPCSCVLYR